MVIAVAGMTDHADIVELVKPLASTMPGPKPPSPPVSTYIGGEARVASGGSSTNMVLAFEYKGGWKNVKKSVVASIVQALLGGGGSFSAGGPGKGMYTRLYRNVLSKHPHVQHCVAYSSLYSETGLMGIHATTDQSQAGNVLNVIGD